MRIPERQTELDALTRKYLEESRTEETRRPAYTATSKSDEEIVAKACAENGGKLDRLWNGDLSDYGHDASSADDGFVHKLWPYTQDEEQIRRIHAMSGLHRPEKSGHRPDYLRRSIDRAPTNVTWFYEWPGEQSLLSSSNGHHDPTLRSTEIHSDHPIEPRFGQNELL